MTWTRILLVPKLATLTLRKPKDASTGWHDYWASVQATGAAGDVLWDSASHREMQAYLPLLHSHCDPALPIVDIGCGNGRFTRWLAAYFPFALGLDLAPDAIRHAEDESRGVANVGFRSVDITRPGVGSRLAAEFGAVNVFIRGVLHVLDGPARLALVGNVRPMLGQRGRLLLSETDFPGSDLDYLVHLGATPLTMPAPLERAVMHLPKPGRFGAVQQRQCFPEGQWQTVAHGETVIEAVAMRGGTQPERIPGYYAVLATRAVQAAQAGGPTATDNPASSVGVPKMGYRQLPSRT